MDVSVLMECLVLKQVDLKDNLFQDETTCFDDDGVDHAYISGLLSHKSKWMR